MEPLDTLGLLGMMMLILDDSRQTRLVLRLRAHNDHATRSELDRLDANGEHLAILVASLQETLTGRTMQDFHEFAELATVELDDPMAAVKRLLLLADHPDEFGNATLDVA